MARKSAERRGGPRANSGGRRRGAGRKPKPRWDFAGAVAALPEDATLAEKLAASMSAVLDNVLASDMHDREKRQELRATAKVAGPLIPKADLMRAERLIRGERAEAETVTKDPQLEPRKKKGKK